ncbi:hypothetical protein DFJ77DRAFT_227397 [Powellomyces hirtus]|nr:hypothetical protein DFJ77DRAFT_227397 [Powellomyces hirtus]
MVQLTEGQVLARARQASQTSISDLASIKNLNLWGQNLTEVSVLERVPNLEVLSLAINSLSSLRPFQNLNKLTELYLRRNDIRNPQELHYLRNLSNLRVLWLNENPIATIPEYRLTIIKMLPNLRKLDDKDVTAGEREAAKAIAGMGYGGAPASDASPRKRVTDSPGIYATPPPPPAPPSHAGRRPQEQPVPQAAGRLQQEQHLSGCGMQVVSQPLYYQEDRPTRTTRQEPETMESLFKSGHSPPRRQPPAKPSVPQAPVLQPGRRQQPADLPQLTGIGFEKQPENQGNSPGDAMQKRRPPWLTRAAETGQIKERIRAASLDAAVVESPLEDPTKAITWNKSPEPIKTRTNNVLFAVLSLLKELDAPSLQVVAYELNQALEGRR